MAWIEGTHCTMMIIRDGNTRYTRYTLLLFPKHKSSDAAKKFE